MANADHTGDTKPMSTVFQCWNCGHDLSDEPLPLSRHANCAKCFTELHCCKHCVYFDPGAVDQCTEDRAEPPTNKEGANFCEWFKPQHGAFEGARSNKSAAAKAQLDALFGGLADEKTTGDEQK